MEIHEDLEENLFYLRYEDEDQKLDHVRWFVNGLNDIYSPNDVRWEYHLERAAEAAPNTVSAFDGERLIPSAISEDERLAELAYLVLTTHHRFNQGKIDWAISEIENYEGNFSDFPVYYRILSEAYLRRSETDDLLAALDSALHAVGLEDSHAGIRETLARCMLEAVEQDLDLSEVAAVPNDREQILDTALDHAVASIEQVEDFSRGHITKGRILSLQGLHAEAQERIETGIEYIDPERKRSNQLISEYHRYLIESELREQEDRLEEFYSEASRRVEDANSSLEDLENEIQSKGEQIDRIRSNTESKYEEIESRLEDSFRTYQTRTLQSLGFFAAILAIIIATVDIAAGFSFLPAVGLLLVLVGGILVSFGSLSAMFGGEMADRRTTAGVVALGMVLVAAGIAMPFLIASLA